MTQGYKTLNKAMDNLTKMRMRVVTKTLIPAQLRTNT